MGATIKIEMDIKELDEIVEYLIMRSYTAPPDEGLKCHIWAGVLRGEKEVALQDEEEARQEEYLSSLEEELNEYDPELDHE